MFRRRQRPARLAVPGRLAVPAARCAGARARSSPSSPSSCAGTAWPSPPLARHRAQARQPSGSSRRWSAASAPARRSARTSSCAATSTLAGESFVSGHAVLVAALAGVVTPVPAGPLEGRAVGARRRGHGRAGLRRRPQPARRRLRRRARHRHRRRPSTWRPASDAVATGVPSATDAPARRRPSTSRRPGHASLAGAARDASSRCRRAATTSSTPPTDPRSPTT